MVMRKISNVRLLFLIYLFIATNLLSPIEAAYLRGFGLSVAQVSMLYLSTPLLCAILEIPTGLLGDWLGRKRTVLLSACSFLLSTLLLLQARSLPILVVAYAFEAAGWSFFSGNTEALIIEDAKRRSEDPNRWLSLFLSALTLGATLAGVLSSGAILSGRTGDLRAPLVLMAVLRSAAVLLVPLLTPAPGTKKGTSPFSILAQSFGLVRQRVTLLIILFEALGRVPFFLTIIMQMLLLRMGLPVEALGLIFSLLFAAQYLFQRHNHTIIERLGRKRVLDGTTLIIIVGLLLMILSYVAPVVLGMLLVQLASPLRYQCLALVKNEIVNDDIRATYLSGISLCVLIFNSVFLASIGWLVEQHAALGLSVLAVSIAGCFLLTTAILEGQKMHVHTKIQRPSGP